MSDSGIWAKLYDDTDKKFARNRNVLTYTVLGSFMLLSVFILAKYPCEYMKFASTATMVLMVPRVIHYTRKSWYLYCLDYCYMVNIAMAYLSFNNNNKFANGTLLTTSFYLIINVYRYKNSLVLHNQETFFTCYMHINPTISIAVAYLNGCIDCTDDYFVLLLESAKWYCFYAALYFPLMFGVLKPIWTKYSIPNLFAYHAAEPFYKELFAKMPFWGPPAIMWLMQISMVVVSSFITYFILRSKEFFLGVCILIVTYTVYRAGTYYIDYMPAMAIRQAKKAA